MKELNFWFVRVCLSLSANKWPRIDEHCKKKILPIIWKNIFTTKKIKDPPLLVNFIRPYLPSHLTRRIGIPLCKCYSGILKLILVIYPTGIYLLKVNNRHRTRCEICPKLTIKTPERRHWRRSVVFIVNFEHISYLVLVFLLLTLNK